MRYLHARARLLLAAALLVSSAPALGAQDPAPTTTSLRGDVDGDGRVTAADAAAVRAYLVRGTLPTGRGIMPAADANGDGRVTAADAALISRFAAGMDVSRFPVGQRVTERVPRMLVEYECSFDTETAEAACQPAPPRAGGDARLAVTVGTPFVSVAGSGGVSYRVDNTNEDTTQTNVAVTNNSSVSFGTTDGVNPHVDGTRLFFSSGPTVTSVKFGTIAAATARIDNPEGTGTFPNPDGTITYTDKPYFQYDGIVTPSATTATELVRFVYSANVKTFAYRVLVSVTVQYEHGWITLAPAATPTLNPGSTVTFTGTEYDVVGQVQTNGITWSSSNPSVATVNSGTGEVTAVAVGTTTITATSNANAQRTGSRGITVTNVNTWEGDVSSNWSVAGNWDAGVVPGSATVAVIPASGTLPNLPVLTANAQVLDLTVGSGRTLGLGGFTLQAGGDVTATGTISNGTLQLSGSDADWQGSVDDVVVSGAGFVASATRATGPISVTGSLSVANGPLNIAVP
jgi:hypothetical protein